MRTRNSPPPCVGPTLGALALGATLLPLPAVGQSWDEIVPGDSTVHVAAIVEHRAEWRLLAIRGDAKRETARVIRDVEFVNHTADEPAMLVRWHVIRPDRSGLDTYYLDRATLLPLAPGYRARWPVLTTSSQSVAALLDGWTEITVAGRDTVAWGDSTVGAWTVELSQAGGRPQRMWILTRPPYLLRRDIVGRDGAVAACWEAVSAHD